MMYSNRLDLDRFFYEVREQEYVIIKMSDFPNYYRGSDIDVFCANKNEFAKLILKVGNSYLDQGFSIKVADKNDGAQTYIDFYFKNEFEFRFDLYQSIPKYTKITLKEFYLYSVIDRRIALTREFNGVKYPIYIPSEADDLLLRYVEYIEWYEQRPDKVGHLEYILNAISSDSSRIRFIDRLHLYTELPDTNSKTKAKNSYLYHKYFRPIIFDIKRAKSMIKRASSMPMREIIRALLRKLCKH